MIVLARASKVGDSVRGKNELNICKRGWIPGTRHPHHPLLHRQREIHLTVIREADKRPRLKSLAANVETLPVSKHRFRMIG
jgi:hypothetical protein